MFNALCDCVCTWGNVFTACSFILFTIYIGRHFAYLVLFTF